MWVLLEQRADRRWEGEGGWACRPGRRAGGVEGKQGVLGGRLDGAGGHGRLGVLFDENN